LPAGYRAGGGCRVPQGPGGPRSARPCQPGRRNVFATKYPAGPDLSAGQRRDAEVKCDNGGGDFADGSLLRRSAILAAACPHVDP